LRKIIKTYLCDCLVMTIIGLALYIFIPFWVYREQSLSYDMHSALYIFKAYGLRYVYPLAFALTIGFFVGEAKRLVAILIDLLEQETTYGDMKKFCIYEDYHGCFNSSELWISKNRYVKLLDKHPRNENKLKMLIRTVWIEPCAGWILDERICDGDNLYTIMKNASHGRKSYSFTATKRSKIILSITEID